jgi:hypothetical protein
MRYVKGVYLDDVTVRKPGGEEVTLNVWMNPETGYLMAVDNMEVPVNRRYIPDPYDEDVRIVFEDTFSGLPK